MQASPEGEGRSGSRKHSYRWRLSIRCMSKSGPFDLSGLEGALNSASFQNCADMPVNRKCKPTGPGPSHSGTCCVL